MPRQKAAKPSPSQPRRTGRPRASGGSSIDPEEDILKAAGKLFSQRGFVGTSTRQIATACGLRQSAIFHWFPSKEAILERLFSRGWDRSLEYFERIGNLEIPGAVKLCLSLSYDANFVAGAEPYIQVMIVPPELRQPKFKRLLKKRQRLIEHFERFIAQAIDEGDFRPRDPRDLARMVLAVDEVILDAAKTQAPVSPRDHANQVVDFALHALVSDHERVSHILSLVAEHSAVSSSPPEGARRRTPARPAAEL
jgi:AcrR family transcriptional regulator